MSPIAFAADPPTVVAGGGRSRGEKKEDGEVAPVSKARGNVAKNENRPDGNRPPSARSARSSPTVSPTRWKLRSRFFAGKRFSLHLPHSLPSGPHSQTSRTSHPASCFKNRDTAPHLPSLSHPLLPPPSSPHHYSKPPHSPSFNPADFLDTYS